MRNIIKYLVVLSILILTCIQTFGQVLTPNSKDHQTVYINAGLDPAVLTSFGYSYRIDSEKFSRDIILFGDVSIPAGNFEFNDYRIKVGIQSSVLALSKWDLSLNGSFILRGTQNSIHSATNYGVAIFALVGYYEICWFSALEFGYDKGIITNVQHTDWYRNNFFPDVKDGYYSNPSGNISLGFRTGYLISNFDITLRGGLAKTEKINDPVGIPIYSSIGINYHFCK